MPRHELSIEEIGNLNLPKDQKQFILHVLEAGGPQVRLMQEDDGELTFEGIGLSEKGVDMMDKYRRRS